MSRDARDYVYMKRNRHEMQGSAFISKWRYQKLKHHLLSFLFFVHVQRHQMRHAI